MTHRGLILLSALATLSVSHVAAQSHETQRPPDGGTRERLISIYIPSKTNSPFSATVNTEWVRQLADGTTITLKNHRAIARDAQGRIFQERRMLVPDNGRQDSFVTQFEISDPVAHRLYICIPQQHVCQLEFFSETVGDSPQKLAGLGRDSSKEPLGKKLIDGVEVEGTLETAVIPSGAIGNDSPISVKREYWYSAKLGFNLISRRQDPRFGNQTFELTEVTTSEPRPQVFNVPSEYRVIDLRKETAIPQPSSP